MKRIPKKMTNLFYNGAKAFGLSKLVLQSYRCRDAEPLLIFSMGKVGTTTVAHTLEHKMPKTAIYHLHTLCQDRIKQEEEVYKGNFQQLGTIHIHLLNSMFLQNRICHAKRNGVRWKVVTLVRDPIARNLSAFFQMLSLHYAEYGFTDRIKAGGDDKLLADMIRFFLEEWDHSRALSWFDREIKQVFGVDVLAEKFQIDRGFQVYHGDFADILVIRLEDLDRCAANAFCEFFGLDSFEIIKGQSSSRKYYSDVYRQFRAQLMLPVSVLDQVYNSRLVKCFYGEHEIRAFREKWGKGRVISPDDRTL